MIKYLKFKIFIISKLFNFYPIYPSTLVVQK